MNILRAIDKLYVQLLKFYTISRATHLTGARLSIVRIKKPCTTGMKWETAEEASRNLQTSNRKQIGLSIFCREISIEVIIREYSISI